jgi:hypothetical protein
MAASQLDFANPEELTRFEHSLAANLEGDRGAQKRANRGLQELYRLSRELEASRNERARPAVEQELRETALALANLARSPVPRHVDFFQTPWFFLKRMSRPVGQGHSPAGNLCAVNERDLSQLDPESSTFWRRPADIASQNLYFGFGRTNLLLQGQPLCTYAGPKESFGRNPGFELDYNGTRLKLKFAEVSSEAFASRLFDALGYHADPTDYAPLVKVRYSRAMFREFNSRKGLETHFTFLGLVPLFTLQLQQHYNPFDYVAAAVLRDGTRWSGDELRHRLLRDSSGPHPEQENSNYRSEVEAALDYLETMPANVQQKAGKSIGPWDFGQLDHAGKRELRGAGLLAGWLGWFDARFDNTRLRIVKTNRAPRLEHFFSDLGGVLGETSGMLYARGELPNAFPWNFTRPAKGPAQDTSGSGAPFPLLGYRPIAPTPAFSAMTLQDARWMGRLIASLTEQQLIQALVASGFDSAQTRLYLEKLISRRDQMIVDLGLASEVPLLRPRNFNRKFSYDPAVAGPVTVQVGDGLISAAHGHDRIFRGKLLSLSDAAQIPN